MILKRNLILTKKTLTRFIRSYANRNSHMDEPCIVLMLSLEQTLLVKELSG